MKIFHQLKAAL